MWQIKNIDLVYPTVSSNDKVNNNDIRCYAISSINFNYEKYQLQFGFDN